MIYFSVTLLDNFTARRSRYDIVFIIIFTVLFYDRNLSTSSVVAVVVAVTPRRTRECATLLTTGGTVARIRHTNTTHTRARLFGSRAHTHTDAGEHYTNKGGRRGRGVQRTNTAAGWAHHTERRHGVRCAESAAAPTRPATTTASSPPPVPEHASYLPSLDIQPLSGFPTDLEMITSSLLSLFFHFLPLPRSCNPPLYSPPLVSQHTAHACAKYNNMHRRLYMHVS